MAIDIGIDTVLDSVFDFFSDGEIGGSLITAGINTASEFFTSGGDGTGGRSQQRPVGLSGSNVSTGRAGQSGTISPSNAVDVDVFHAEWMARLKLYAELAAKVDTGIKRPQQVRSI